MAFFEYTPAGGGAQPDQDRPTAGAWIAVFLGVALLAAGITGLWIGMRDVMEIGGFCAEGGPYVIAQDCPDRAEVLIPVGTIVGLIGLGIAAFGLARVAKASAALLILAWPALFISLGWNFMQYGLNPPDDEGTVVGWIVCGVIFFAMGLPVLLAAVPIVKSIPSEKRAVILGVVASAAVAGVVVAGMAADSLA
jgi:hypothetical protein